MTDGDSIRTAVRDSILTNVSAGLDADAVRGVEWAAVDDTVTAVRERNATFRPAGVDLVDFETYRGVCL